MAVESKPLFHPEVIRQHVRSFHVPERITTLQPKLDHWAKLISSGRADDLKESELLPDFLTDFFCELLGYTRPAGPSDTFTLSRERHVEEDGQFADAVLGKKSEIKSRVPANFVGWEKDHALFDRELEKVVRPLRADDGGREKPPESKL